MAEFDLELIELLLVLLALQLLAVGLGHLSDSPARSG
jgi:hypothetical protein